MYCIWIAHFSKIRIKTTLVIYCCIENCHKPNSFKHVFSQSSCGSEVQAQLSWGLQLGPHEGAIMVWPELRSHLETRLGKHPLFPLTWLPAAFSALWLQDLQQLASLKPTRKGQQDSRASQLAGPSYIS